MTSQERLRVAGLHLFGAEWQRPMARALGPHFPGDPREGIDPRLVRRWYSGGRPIPAWVDEALPKLLRGAAAARRKEATGLRRIADDLAKDAGA